MSDDTNKIAEKLKAQSAAWWDVFSDSFTGINRIAELLDSIGLTVSDDAGVLRKELNRIKSAGEGMLKAIGDDRMRHGETLTEPMLQAEREMLEAISPVVFIPQPPDAHPEPGETEAKSGPEWKEEYGYASSPDYDPSDGPAKTLGLKPTAETQGDEDRRFMDEAYEKFIKESGWPMDELREELVADAWVASEKHARAELLSKIAGVKKQISDHPSDYLLLGVDRGKFYIRRDTVLNLIDAAFPSDPGEVKP